MGKDKKGEGMNTKIRYEFLIHWPDREEATTWGYRSNKKAARKRLKEIEYFFHDHGHKEVRVEPVKVMITETYHPADLETEDE